MIAVLAMVGASLGEYLAGAVIAVMLATGRALERVRRGRADRELPRSCWPAPRDRPPVRGRRADVADRSRSSRRRPAAGQARRGRARRRRGRRAPAVLDESALTGESRLVRERRATGSSAASVNAGGPFDLRAIATADDSTYAGIVRLVAEAQTVEGAVRPAGRPLRAALRAAEPRDRRARLAGHRATRSAPSRCWSSRRRARSCWPRRSRSSPASRAAARRGVIVKGGAALETLGRARVLLFDKTGTLTAGAPLWREVERRPDERSGRGPAPRRLARPGVAARARRRHRPCGARARPRSRLPDRRGRAGRAGIRGRVEGRGGRGRQRDVGRAGTGLPAWARELRRRVDRGLDERLRRGRRRLAGALVLDDPIRPRPRAPIRALRQAGIDADRDGHRRPPAVAEIGRRGDRASTASSPSAPRSTRSRRSRPSGSIARRHGHGRRWHQRRAGAGRGRRRRRHGCARSDRVVGGRGHRHHGGSTRPARGGDPIARRSPSIAVQSVVVGIGLSIVAMVVAAFGLLPPVAAHSSRRRSTSLVILNALRALRRRDAPGGPDGRLAETREHLRASTATAAEIVGIRGGGRPTPTRDPCRTGSGALSFLVDELMPHEELRTTPSIRRWPRRWCDDPTAALTGPHREIFHLVRLDGRWSTTSGEGPGPTSSATSAGPLQPPRDPRAPLGPGGGALPRASGTSRPAEPGRPRRSEPGRDLLRRSGRVRMKRSVTVSWACSAWRSIRGELMATLSNCRPDRLMSGAATLRRGTLCWSGSPSAR